VRLLGKELRTLFREPMVVLTIIMPFIVYSSMAPFYGSLAEQTREAQRLEGVNVALSLCRVDDATRLLVSAMGSHLASGGVNVTIVDSCSALELLRKGYNVVLVLNGSLMPGRSASMAVYVKGSLGRFAKTLALPSVVSGHFSRLIAERQGARVNTTSYIYLNGRLYSFPELNSLFGSVMMLSYSSFFILFPAASMGAALIGAEREERMFEVLLSLPIRRRSIAFSKAAAAVIVALLTTASAMAGIYVVTGHAGIMELKLSRYYGPGELGLYAAALVSEALFVVMLAMTVGLFATTIRGAQSAAVIAVLPAIIPPMSLMAGLPLSYKTALLPYMAILYTGLSPIIGRGYAAASTAAQFIEALAAAALFIKVLESETAVTGPETLRRLLARLRRRR